MCWLEVSERLLLAAGEACQNLALMSDLVEDVASNGLSVLKPAAIIGLLQDVGSRYAVGKAALAMPHSACWKIAPALIDFAVIDLEHSGCFILHLAGVYRKLASL